MHASEAHIRRHHDMHHGNSKRNVERRMRLKTSSRVKIRSEFRTPTGLRPAPDGDVVPASTEDMTEAGPRKRATGKPQAAERVWCWEDRIKGRNWVPKPRAEGRRRRVDWVGWWKARPLSKFFRAPPELRVCSVVDTSIRSWLAVPFLPVPAPPARVVPAYHPWMARFQHLVRSNGRISFFGQRTSAAFLQLEDVECDANAAVLCLSAQAFACPISLVDADWDLNWQIDISPYGGGERCLRGAGYAQADSRRTPRAWEEDMRV
ncbi:hypothetical protein K438DRAFT_1767737 [Mycena galopus ATCC 62051]|nr:hypothetical protein K438DRAFT_1767737 [Mycena galopus ATCC 62051]